jgi:ATP-binding cassette, subfamily B, bacterial
MTLVDQTVVPVHCQNRLKKYSVYVIIELMFASPLLNRLRAEIRDKNVAKSEFTVKGAHRYNHKSAVRWVISHIMRYNILFLGAVVLMLTAYVGYTLAQVKVGTAIGELLTPAGEHAILAAIPAVPTGLVKITGNYLLVSVSLTIFGLLAVNAIAGLFGTLAIETIGQRLEVDSRAELYISLLGKSQTFHNRQRVGDIMARATDDVQQLNGMMNPGVSISLEILLGMAIPLLFIANLKAELLLVPVLFIVIYFIMVVRYTRTLTPVMMHQRSQFGVLNAGLEETISGIEVVKASAQEDFERRKFRSNARLFRDYAVRQGYIEAGYLPILLYGIAFGLAFLHAIALYQQHRMAIAEIISFMGIMGVFSWPTFASIFSWSLIQNGLAGANRIVTIIQTETELDENEGGYTAPIHGNISFENVSFSYDQNRVLDRLSFNIQAGQTVALVGQTGSGKSTLSELVNRTYDPTYGRVLIDGVDVKGWDLTSLRSQISRIEQDIFLFSRSIAENIAFGAPTATQEQIEQAAHEAQAHNFIMSFKDGYATILGERGVTLSGGQRQRVALARAFLSNPRILILDDSTSAIDSATEDEIQKAIRRAQQGRTTILITHRLSQIRWADHILVLDKGRIVADGSHEELLRRSNQYRRIFSRYDMELPPMEVEVQTA